jgi:hypothetical protein
MSAKSRRSGAVNTSEGGNSSPTPTSIRSCSKIRPATEALAPKRMPPVAPREGVSFTGESISYATLANWLTRLHHTVRGLVDHGSLAGERPTVVQVEQDLRARSGFCPLGLPTTRRS